MEDFQGSPVKDPTTPRIQDEERSLETPSRRHLTEEITTVAFRDPYCLFVNGSGDERTRPSHVFLTVTTSSRTETRSQRSFLLTPK